jgi:hypothetical protein
MPEQKTPVSGAFRLTSLMYFCSGQPIHFCSGVDSLQRSSAPGRSPAWQRRHKTDEHFKDIHSEA